MKNLFSLLCQGIVQIGMTLKISLAKVAYLKLCKKENDP